MDPILLRGCGIVSDAFDIFKYKTKYAGERHGMVHDPITNRLVVANYLGPFTALEAREANNDTIPVNKLDACAKEHDYTYRDIARQFDKDGDKKAFNESIWKADDKFKECAKSQKDDKVIGNLSANAIAVKEIAEKTGLIPTKTFSGRGLNEIKRHSSSLPPYVKTAIEQSSELANSSKTKDIHKPNINRDNMQNIMFNKQFFTEKKAKAYMKKHDYKPIKDVDITKNYLRYRLKEPKDTDYKTYKIDEGVLSAIFV